jgi:hypothetical protein
VGQTHACKFGGGGVEIRELPQQTVPNLVRQLRRMFYLYG